MTLKPDWYVAIENLSAEDLEKFKDRLHRCRQDKILCECKIKEVDTSGNCVKCWKYVKDYHESDFFWGFPESFGGGRDRFMFYDKKVNDIIHGETEKTKKFLMALVVNSGRIWKSIKYGMEIEKDYKCEDCGNKMEDTSDIILHHIIPHSKGGTEVFDNLKLLCKTCHSKYFMESLPEISGRHKE